MKTTAFFALAITAVLLGFWQDPSRPNDRPHDRQAGRGEGAPAPQMPVTHAAPVAGGTLAAQAPPLPAPITTPGPPAPTTPAFAPPLQTTSTPAPATADTGSAHDWRDDALDLLSQIGLLCPPAGCDSLEDD